MLGTNLALLQLEGGNALLAVANRIQVSARQAMGEAAHTNGPGMHKVGSSFTDKCDLNKA